jgi:hypothetical protein
MFLVSLVHLLSGLAQAGDESGLSLIIRGPTNTLKEGDEIPIAFTISNHGTDDFTYENRTYDWTGQTQDYKLAAKTASGDSVPAPPPFRPAFDMGGIVPIGVVHPGESFTKIIPLNHWALVTQSGRYEITGSYRANRFSNKPNAQATSAPLSIEILPRTKQEMEEYIKGLTNQVATVLTSRATRLGGFDWVLWDESMTKLMYTCKPEIVPTLLGVLYDTNTPFIMEEDWWPTKALFCYVPHTEESLNIILDYVATRGLNWSVAELFPDYGAKREELKPIIERALAATNIGEWEIGADLAASGYWDDAFNPRLIAIASDPNSSFDARAIAMEALACNRSEAGLKTLKALLDDQDIYNSGDLAWAIAHGYGYPHDYSNTPASRHLQSADFDSKEVRPLVERLLASTNELYQRAGLDLAAVFDDDSLTPKLVAFATSSELPARLSAIRALAFNRTDVGVKTLQSLLHDPEEQVSSATARAIRDAYTARGAARGKQLRPEDFDAKFQQAEVAPAK